VRQRFRPPQTTRYYYDYENRLRRVAPPGGPAINYRYDYAGNLVEKREEGRNGERVRYVYDAGVEPLAQQENGGWTDNVVVNGKIIETFRQSYGNNPNNRLFYHTDALGSVVALSNRTGRVVRTTEYDPWGKVLVDNSPSGMGMGGPVSIAYEFVGGYGVRRDVDDKSIMGVRMYDAGVGRFTTQDPIGFRSGDLNLYRYVRNNSVNMIDPLGLLCPSNVKEYLKTFYSQLTDVSARTTINIDLLVTLSSHESGWGGEHARELHNIWGLTHGGGANINFSSYQAGNDYWVKTWGRRCQGSQNIFVFVGLLLTPPAYNSNPGYEDKIVNQYDFWLRIKCDCMLEAGVR
jgi:RHS repeat-associated protein